MSKLITLVDDYWPLVLVVHNGMPTIEAMDEYYETINRWHARNEPIGMITDLANATAPGRDFRKHEAERMTHYHDETKRLVFSSAMIAPSAVLRIALNSIFFIKRPPSEYTVARTPEEVWDWQKGKFAEQGFEMPITREKLAEIILLLRDPES